METQVRTPQDVFNQPQRLVVPLFQRPYVWTEERQWEPLWEDIVRVAERVIADPAGKHQAHFLGAVVLQQVPNAIGMMQQRTIIDGQQRLTTLQVLLDALRMELLDVGQDDAAKRLEALVTNAPYFRSQPEDQFKVWPTNRDRPGFHAAMSGAAALPDGSSEQRIFAAHAYFRQMAGQWLRDVDGSAIDLRGDVLERTVRTLLQMVVIDLGADENAQEIFETLNARGAQLTAADLIKNFVFQRLLETGKDVETIYEKSWKDLESAFWEKEISMGRMLHPRSSVFLNHWLTARTGEEIVAREVFDRFKRFATHDAGIDMRQVLEQLHRSSIVYRDFVEASVKPDVRRLSLFAYRTSVLESEVIKPLVLVLLDPEQKAIDAAQFNKALAVVESWMVRRMLVRATTKSYTSVIAEMIRYLNDGLRPQAGDALESYLSSQKSAAAYWPDDQELRGELTSLLAYRRLGRGRLRMVLEAIEDYRRGWTETPSPYASDRVTRGRYPIEHVMPRKWQQHWPYTGDPELRDRVIHTLGNLTLLTNGLNSKVSNGPWGGEGGKRENLNKHDSFFINRDLLELGADGWDEERIRERTQSMIDTIIAIWPVPPGHRASFATDSAPIQKQIGILELLDAGVLQANMTLYPRRKELQHRTATLLRDGRIEVAGVQCGSPSEAAGVLTQTPTNGWWFFLVDAQARVSLKMVRKRYLQQIDVDDDESDDD